MRRVTLSSTLNANLSSKKNNNQKKIVGKNIKINNSTNNNVTPSSNNNSTNIVSSNSSSSFNNMITFLATPNDHSINLNNNNTSMKILVIVIDGVGLALVAVATIFDASHEWDDTFYYYYNYNNDDINNQSIVTLLWMIGRIVQVTALLLLMSYAATLNSFPILEYSGMFMLTMGPMLCISASLLFNMNAYRSLNHVGNIYSYDNIMLSTSSTSSSSSSVSAGHSSSVTSPFEPYFPLPSPSSSPYFNIEWMFEEVLELMGIVLLDLSFIKTTNELELTCEILGFTLLIMAAILDFSITTSTVENLNLVDDAEYDSIYESLQGIKFTSLASFASFFHVIAVHIATFISSSYSYIISCLPTVSYRFDMIHLTDVFGLLLLTLVSVADYQYREDDKESGSSSHIDSDDNTSIDFNNMSNNNHQNLKSSGNIAKSKFHNNTGSRSNGDHSSEDSLVINIADTKKE